MFWYRYGLCALFYMPRFFLDLKRMHIFVDFNPYNGTANFEFQRISLTD